MIFCPVETRGLKIVKKFSKKTPFVTLISTLSRIDSFVKFTSARKGSPAQGYELCLKSDL